MKRADDPAADDDRREFLKKTGRFAAVPPAVAFLLSTSMSSKAIAASSGQPATRPGNGWGDDNHVHTGPPGQSQSEPKTKNPKAHS